MTGEELRKLRIFLDETYAEFAKRFGVTRQTIYQWEQRGTPSHGAARMHVDRVLLRILLLLGGPSDMRKEKGGG